MTVQELYEPPWVDTAMIRFRILILHHLNSVSVHFWQLAFALLIFDINVSLKNFVSGQIAKCFDS